MILPDFFAVEEALQRIFLAAPELGNASVDIETELSFQEGDIIKIYLDRWDAPETLQTLSAGQSTKMLVSFVIWAFHGGLDLLNTMKRRNELVSIIQVVLMRDRTLQNTVESCWVTGGEFQTIPHQNGFVIGGEIQLTAAMTART